MTHREDGGEPFRWLRTTGVFLIGVSVWIAAIKGINELVDWWLT